MNPDYKQLTKQALEQENLYYFLKKIKIDDLKGMDWNNNMEKKYTIKPFKWTGDESLSYLIFFSFRYEVHIVGANNGKSEWWAFTPKGLGIFNSHQEAKSHCENEMLKELLDVIQEAND